LILNVSPNGLRILGLQTRSRNFCVGYVHGVRTLKFTNQNFLGYLGRPYGGETALQSSEIGCHVAPNSLSSYIIFTGSSSVESNLMDVKFHLRVALLIVLCTTASKPSNISLLRWLPITLLLGSPYRLRRSRCIPCLPKSMLYTTILNSRRIFIPPIIRQGYLLICIPHF
jgi:hypothetical protein